MSHACIQVLRLAWRSKIGVGCDSGTPASTAATPTPGAAAAAALPAKYKTAGVINIATGIYPPMEMFDENQKLTGFDYDLAQALGAKLGVRMDMQQQAFASIIPSLQSGKHDIIVAGMNDTPERQKTIDFVDYFHAGFSILVLAGNPERITTVLDLCGKKVAVQKATVQAEILRGYDKQRTAKGPGPIKIAGLPLETDVKTAVRSGKAVADVVDSAVAAYTAQTAGGGKTFEVIRDRDASNPAGCNPVYIGIGLLKKDSALSSALLLVLDAVVTDGTYQKILKKYALTDYTVDKAGMNLGS